MDQICKTFLTLIATVSSVSKMVVKQKTNLQTPTIPGTTLSKPLRPRDQEALNEAY